MWSYNQGTMLGAAALFYRYTGDTGYLNRGRQIAAASLAFHGAGDRLWQQDPPFNAVYFHNLQLLALTAGDDASFAYLGPLADYLDRAWSQGRAGARSFISGLRPVMLRLFCSPGRPLGRKRSRARPVGRRLDWHAGRSPPWLRAPR